MNKFVTILLVGFAVAQASADSSMEKGMDEFIDLSLLGPTIFGVPDNATGLLVAEYDPNTYEVNPEELGSYLEGDMLMPPGFSRNGLQAISSRWPGAIVPYDIFGTFAPSELQSIRNAFEEYHTRTCIRFVQRTIESDYISIINGKTGCWSSVGRLSGRQEVNLQSPGCTWKIGTIIHELMHVLGFMHEQNRSDRDAYVTVNWDNIRPGTEINFSKSNPYVTYSYGVEYDYGSVMHYSPYAFSKNGKATIVPKFPYYASMGQRNQLSVNDVKKINGMYNCEAVIVAV